MEGINLASSDEPLSEYEQIVKKLCNLPKFKEMVMLDPDDIVIEPDMLLHYDKVIQNWIDVVSFTNYRDNTLLKNFLGIFANILNHVNANSDDQNLNRSDGFKVVAELKRPLWRQKFKDAIWYNMMNQKDKTSYGQEIDFYKGKEGKGGVNKLFSNENLTKDLFEIIQKIPADLDKLRQFRRRNDQIADVAPELRLIYEKEIQSNISELEQRKEALEDFIVVPLYKLRESYSFGKNEGRQNEPHKDDFSSYQTVFKEFFIDLFKHMDEYIMKLAHREE